jgi:hypothetical protein
MLNSVAMENIIFKRNNLIICGNSNFQAKRRLGGELVMHIMFSVRSKKAAIK